MRAQRLWSACAAGRCCRSRQRRPAPPRNFSDRQRRAECARLRRQGRRAARRYRGAARGDRRRRHRYRRVLLAHPASSSCRPVPISFRAADQALRQRHASAPAWSWSASRSATPPSGSTDHAPGFGDPAAPRGVIMTTAKLLDGTPTSGGKDYTHKGEGNDAYENFVENLTIDVGAGNPGAIGIDYLANNFGAIRDVRVVRRRRAAAPSAFRCSANGPARRCCSASRCRASTPASRSPIPNMASRSITCTLSGQRDVGLANDGNAVAAARSHRSRPAAPPSPTRAAAAWSSLTDSHAAPRRRGCRLLVNRGAVVAHDVTLDGFCTARQQRWTAWSACGRGSNGARRRRRADLTLADAPPPAPTIRRRAG